MGETPPFDLVVCVGPSNPALAIRAIRSVVRFAGPRRVYLISARAQAARLQGLADEGIDLYPIDEDAIVPGVTLARLAGYLEGRGAPATRAGWYLQQFAKIAACAIEGIAPHYLIFDADTLLLRPVSFFEPDGRVRLATAHEHHAPYFDLKERLFGHRRLVGYSFITEHMMVETRIMAELQDALRERLGGTDGPYALLDLVAPEHLAKSGFSEFEFYGNYLARHYPERYVPRPLACWRHAAARYGHLPSGFALRVLARDYDLASFESWQPASRKQPLYDALAVIQALWLAATHAGPAPLATYRRIARP